MSAARPPLLSMDSRSFQRDLTSRLLRPSWEAPGERQDAPTRRPKSRSQLIRISDPSALARAWLESAPLFLAVLLTGWAGQVIEIAVVDSHGGAVFESLVRLVEKSTPPSEVLRGLDIGTLRRAPEFSAVWPAWREILAQAVVIVYDADLVQWRILETARAAGSERLDIFGEVAALVAPQWGNAPTHPARPQWLCARELHQRCYAEREPNTNGLYPYRSIANAAAHCAIQVRAHSRRARDEAELVRQLVLRIAYGCKAP